MTVTNYFLKSGDLDLGDLLLLGDLDLLGDMWLVGDLG